MEIRLKKIYGNSVRIFSPFRTINYRKVRYQKNYDKDEMI